MPEAPAYRYAARVVRWVDGDTVDVSLDLGFEITVNTRLRLYGIDTPEKTIPTQKAAALKALARARELAPEGSDVVISTYKAREKFGRYLAIVHLAGSDLDNVARTLIQEGLAKTYFGGTKTT